MRAVVAHTHVADRAIVAHAIRVLERSRGWDFEDKVKVGGGEDRLADCCTGYWLAVLIRC